MSGAVGEVDLSIQGSDAALLRGPDGSGQDLGAWADATPSRVRRGLNVTFRFTQPGTSPDSFVIVT